jgi:hypothetical protein
VPNGIADARCLSVQIVWKLHRGTLGSKNGDHAANVVQKIFCFDFAKLLIAAV